MGSIKGMVGKEYQDERQCLGRRGSDQGDNPRVGGDCQVKGKVGTVKGLDKEECDNN